MRKLVLTAIIFFILGVVVGYFINKPSLEIKKDVKNTQTVQRGEKFPNVLVKAAGMYLYIGTDNININPFEGEGMNMQIVKNDYPKLFGPSDIEYYITADEINDKIHGKKFIFILNNISSHGFYVPYYGIIIDPESQSIVYETPELLGGSSLTSYEILENGSTLRFDLLPYFFNDTCTFCKLPIIEYISYDPQTKKFITINNKYSAIFKGLLETYEEQAQKCHYNGKYRSVDEVIQIAGKDVRCDDMSNPDEPEKNNASYYITVGKFKSIIENIKQIISGENKSLLQ